MAGKPNPAHFFEPIRTGDTDLNKVQDAVRAAFNTLADQVKRAIDSAVAAVKSATVTTILQAVAVTTHAQLRAILGSDDGISRPRAVIVAGNLAAFDTGQGVYIWDSASVAADDNNLVIKPTAQVTGAGRWRKL